MTKDAGRGDADRERIPAPPETILRVAEDGGVNGEVCITEGASQHIRAEIERLRKVEDASGILLNVLEDMKPSGADVPAELDYAMDDLRRALEDTS